MEIGDLSCDRLEAFTGVPFLVTSGGYVFYSVLFRNQWECATLSYIIFPFFPYLCPPAPPAHRPPPGARADRRRVELLQTRCDFRYRMLVQRHTHASDVQK